MISTNPHLPFIVCDLVEVGEALIIGIHYFFPTSCVVFTTL